MNLLNVKNVEEFLTEADAQNIYYKMFKIMVDYECGNLWWDNGGNKVWEELTNSDDWRDEIIVDYSMFQNFIKKASKIDGWEDKPFWIHEMFLIDVSEIVPDYYREI